MAAAAPTPPRERLIAEGTSARLFVSQDSTGRPAALKLSRDVASDRALLAEVDAGARFTHPALLPVWEHGRDEHGRVWLLMPLLSGQTLADWHPETSALLDGLGPIADALDLLHHDGFGHADLKPANILLRESEGHTDLLLGDLGLISRLGAPAAGGTPAYLSPSRLDGKPFTWLDDLHAFAVSTFECLTGRLPWAATEGETLLKEIRGGRAVSLRAMRTDLPGELDPFFGATLRTEGRHTCMMDWVDELRSHLGLGRLPRCLFLGEVADSTAAITSRESLTSWLQLHLSSGTSTMLDIGHEELRTIEDLARGDVHRLRRLLDLLLKEQWLQDRFGQAVFSEDATVIGARLRAAMRVDDRARADAPAGWGGLLTALPIGASREEFQDALSLPSRELEALLDELLSRGLLVRDEGGRLQGAGLAHLRNQEGCIPALPKPLFEILWRRGENRPGARLELLGVAVATGAEALLSTLPHAAQLDLIERAPGETCDRLRQLLAPMSRGTDTERLLGLLDIIRFVRTDALDAAIARYWTIDVGLSTPVNAALNRLLVYQLTDSGRVHEAQAFLQRWKARHSAEIAGSSIEIQIAARELNVLSTFGAHAEAAALAQEYQRRFRDREGAWILHVALASLAEDRGDRADALRQSEAALTGLQAESGPENMELDLLAYLATTIIAASDRDRWVHVESLLDRAERLAAKLEIHAFTHRLQAARALSSLYRGDAESARSQFLRIRHSAAQSGELKRALFIDTGLVIAAREEADYQWLLSHWPHFEQLVAGQESLRELLSFKEELAQLLLSIGDLAAAWEVADAAFKAAEESEQILFVGLLNGIRGSLYLRGEQPQRAALILRSVLTALESAHSFRRRNEYQLELIAADPEADPDGTLIAAVIDHEEAVGERRLLPRAWQLEARRLRRAGGIGEAALALEEAFRVAGTLVSPEHRWPLHVEAAELALAAGERQAARADLERAVEILHDLSLQFTEPTVRERFLARPDRRAVLTRLQSLGDAQTS